MNVYVPYSDFVELGQDSAKLASVISILNTKFPDDTCQLIAIKSVLGIEEEIKEDPVPETPEEPQDPIEPEPDDEEVEVTP